MESQRLSFALINIGHTYTRNATTQTDKSKGSITIQTRPRVSVGRKVLGLAFRSKSTSVRACTRKRRTPAVFNYEKKTPALVLSNLSRSISLNRN